LPSCPTDSEAFLDAFNTAQKGVGLRFLLGKMKFLIIRDRKFEEACKFIKSYTQKHIDRVRRQQAKSGRPNDQRKVILINELAKETPDGPELCSQLLNMFFAGHDTPAVALTNIFFLLARHPKVWNTCKAEVEGLQKEDLTFERLKSLRYIQHVISEGNDLPSNILHSANSPSNAGPTTSRLANTRLHGTFDPPHRRRPRRHTTHLR
jgi:cytochrome P450